MRTFPLSSLSTECLVGSEKQNRNLVRSLCVDQGMNFRSGYQGNVMAPINRRQSTQSFMAGSSSMGEEDRRFAELLKPIKDLTVNWNVPLAEYLQRLLPGTHGDPHQFRWKDHQSEFKIVTLIAISV